MPKQYRELKGRPVLRRAIEALIGHPCIAGVQVVADPEDRTHYDRATSGLNLPEPVAGGSTRQASVLAGLEALAARAPAAVLVHDAARPLVPSRVIDRVLAALARSPAVVPTLPVADTLRRFADGLAAGEVARDGLHRVQTPQGFWFAALLAAHRRHADDQATDDAALMALTGHAVAHVPGDEAAIKITTEADLLEAERRITPRRWATGLGFDVHRLAADRPLVLMGVRVPFPLGLAGHSDADVALHAVTDAILGALADGDIGTHFPPDEARWRDADSALFVRHAAARAALAGATIEHVDVTIIGERPKIAPFREAMRERLAALLQIPAARIGLKATTTERLGFTGRGEGLAAQAVATLSFGS